MKNSLLFLLLLFALNSTTSNAQFIDSDVPLEITNMQLIAEDLYISGSLGIGLDIVNNQTFGFDTFVMKENNLRMFFDDTSSSATFPGNDWRFIFNDTSDGGANYFAVQDATANTTPFTVTAGSGNNALYISASGGNVGLGTNTPVLELQITDGDTPSIRLEQNGSAGWTPQTWDLAGNESNFFIRDVNTGNLSFRIRPNAPANSIYVAPNGTVGLGTDTPATNASLDLNSNTKALLLNRITTLTRTDLSANATAGMVAYDSEENIMYYWNGTEWVNPAQAEFQNLTSATLSDTNLTIAIDNGTSATVDLAPILAPLQSAITELKNENIAQMALINDLITRMEAVEACACGGTLNVPSNGDANRTGIVLEQNIPNPFNSDTLIKYNIPVNYNTAKIIITSLTGKIISEIPITQFGSGSVSFNKSNLQSAVYLYTLFVDGQNIVTKRLVVN